MALFKVKAEYDYEAQEEGELSFKEDDIILVLEEDESGWWTGELNGLQGVFPSNFVEKIEEGENEEETTHEGEEEPQEETHHEESEKKILGVATIGGMGMSELQSRLAARQETQGTSIDEIMKKRKEEAAKAAQGPDFRLNLRQSPGPARPANPAKGPLPSTGAPQRPPVPKPSRASAEIRNPKPTPGQLSTSPPPSAQIKQGPPSRAAPKPKAPASAKPKDPEMPTCRALHDYEAEEDGELSFKEGDIITIQKKEDGGWWRGELRNQVGWFPTTFVEEVTSEKNESPPAKPAPTKSVPIPKAQPPKPTVSAQAERAALATSPPKISPKPKLPMGRGAPPQQQPGKQPVASHPKPIPGRGVQKPPVAVSPQKVPTKSTSPGQVNRPEPHPEKPKPVAVKEISTGVWSDKLPPFNTFCDELVHIFDSCKNLSSGSVESSHADAKQFGFSICTIDGVNAFSHGDTSVHFPLGESVHPFLYAFGCETLGSDKVSSWVGSEKTAIPFKEFVMNSAGKPHSPFITSGAVTIASHYLSFNKTPSKAIGNIVEKLSSVAEERIACSMTNYLEYSKNSNLDAAFTYWLKHSGSVPKEQQASAVLDFYLQLKSVEANCKKGATLAATLANSGISPSGKNVIQANVVNHVLSSMKSCGTDEHWSRSVSLTSSYSSSGVVLLIIPKLMGICIYSPAVDEKGASVRGLEFAKQISSKYSW